MEARYNVYFAGELLAGHDPASVRSALAKLFNANDATLDQLFSGKSQLLKRDCDKATALKYKQALEGAGAAPIIKVVAAQPAVDKSATPAAGKAMTAAERIAALAAAPDVGAHKAATPAAQAPAPADDGDIQLAPPGTDTLRPEERPAPPTASVRAPDLEVDIAAERLSAAAPPPPPPPNTDHLSTAAVGDSIPTLSREQAPVTPDISALELTPDGTDFTDCAAPVAAAPALDLSAIELAPSGSDVLEVQYRARHDTPAPSTDHLALDD